MKNICVLCFLGFIGKVQAQNVGIGISTPAYPLTVQGTNLGRGVTVKNGAMEVGFFNNGTVAFVQTWSEHNLNFATGNGGAKITLRHANGYVGINTAEPTAQLDINGNLRLRNGAVASAVLTSDAAGNANWQPQVSFSAQTGYLANLVNKTSTTILYGTELFDVSGNYDAATGKFTAPVAGIFHFDASIRLQTGIPPDGARLLLCVNGVPQVESEPVTGFIQISGNLKLSAGNIVDIRFYFDDSTTGNQTVSSNVLKNHFSGFMVR